jgi:hypothetical protein
MADTVRKISANKHLQARGLFVLASTHYRKAREAETMMAELLGFDDTYCGCLSDECVDGGDFDAGMKKEGFVVIDPKRKMKR